MPEANSRSDLGRTAKGQETRQRILSAAVELFQKRGYEGTTIRLVAKHAGVSVGNAYYYFQSKEELIQGFYRRMHDGHREAVAPLLKKHRSFKQRFLQALLAHLDTAQPYHAFSGALFQHAAHPQSPLNPFSEASRETRDASIEIFREVVEGASGRFPDDLRESLPEILWFIQMAIVLYWIHDDTPECEKTRRLAERVCTMVGMLISVLKLAPMKALRKKTLATIAEFGFRRAQGEV